MILPATLVLLLMYRHLLGELGEVNLLIDSTILQQFVMSPLPHQHTIIQHQNLICTANRSSALRNDKGRRRILHIVNGTAQTGICGIIKGRCTVVQNQDRGFAYQGSGNSI